MWRAAIGYAYVYGGGVNGGRRLRRRRINERRNGNDAWWGEMLRVGRLCQEFSADALIFSGCIRVFTRRPHLSGTADSLNTLCCCYTAPQLKISKHNTASAREQLALSLLSHISIARIMCFYLH